MKYKWVQHLPYFYIQINKSRKIKKSICISIGKKRNNEPKHTLL